MTKKFIMGSIDKGNIQSQPQKPNFAMIIYLKLFYIYLQIKQCAVCVFFVKI